MDASPSPSSSAVVTLVSRDGVSFEISHTLASYSSVLTTTREQKSFREAQSRTVELDFDGNTIKVVVDYLKHRSEEDEKDGDGNASEASDEQENMKKKN